MSSLRVKLGNTRTTGKEQFYTPVDTAIDVVAEVLELRPELRSATWLEPSAGTGAFIKALNHHGITDIIALDIEPKHPDVTMQDFLTWQSEQRNLVAIGNPPFGRNNALSIPFFNHSAQICSHIAFLVPRSWRKWSVSNRLDLHMHKIHDRDLNINYVADDGSDPYRGNLLRTCLQVWERDDVPRDLVSIKDHEFISKVSPEEADVAMKVFGYGCGQLLYEFDRVPNTTLLFLKVNDERVWDALKTIDFSVYFNNVAYTEALAFTEINHALNALFITPQSD